MRFCIQWHNKYFSDCCIMSIIILLIVEMVPSCKLVQLIQVAMRRRRRRRSPVVDRCTRPTWTVYRSRSLPCVVAVYSCAIFAPLASARCPHNLQIKQSGRRDAAGPHRANRFLNPNKSKTSTSFKSTIIIRVLQCACVVWIIKWTRDKITSCLIGVKLSLVKNVACKL